MVDEDNLCESAVVGGASDEFSPCARVVERGMVPFRTGLVISGYVR
jgi:hypothetical protein